MTQPPTTRTRVAEPAGGNDDGPMRTAPSMPAAARDRLRVAWVLGLGPHASRTLRRQALRDLRRVLSDEAIVELLLEALAAVPRGRAACKPRSRTRGRRR